MNNEKTDELDCRADVDAARFGLTRGVAAICVRPDRKSIEQMLLRAEGWKAPVQGRRQNAGHMLVHNQVKPEP